MKLQIDLSNSLPLKGQLLAVDEYIRNYTKSTIDYNCWGEEMSKEDKDIVFSQFPILETTPKDTGFKIETDFGNYHVSCHKTKGGLYKFKTWKAV